jgi:hypothetical protein
MWKSIKSHVQFCWVVLKDEYRRFGKLRTAYLIVTFVVVTVLGTLLGMSIRQLLGYVYPFLSLTGWIIVVLALAVAFLVYLTTAIRRFHVSTVRRVAALSLVRGQGAQLLRSVTRGTRLSLDDLDKWKTAIATAFYESYEGYAKALPMQEHWPRTPDDMSIDDQSSWVYDRLGELDRLLEKELENMPPAHR